uniref:FAR1 domain-containing protein n=1 Tax=Aegilops tauschii subsp. strangulata TaxID=200361 RepID=A0A453DNP6_AEGTS
MSGDCPLCASLRAIYGERRPSSPCLGEEGIPKKGNKRTCRCRCPAMIRLLRSSDNGWYITYYRSDHNHALTERCGEKV